MRRRVFGLIAVSVLAGSAMLSPPLAAADTLTVTIRNHKFQPAEINVPANTRVQLTVVNADPTPEEFESPSLKIEKVVSGNSRATVRIGPLKPGRYPFVGEFHESTAKGVVIAK